MIFFVAIGIILGLIWLFVVFRTFRIAVAIFVGLVVLVGIVGMMEQKRLDHLKMTAVCERVAHGDYSDGLSWDITNRPGFWAPPNPIHSKRVLVCEIANPSNWQEVEPKFDPIDCNDGIIYNSLFPECQRKP